MMRLTSAAWAATLILLPGCDTAPVPTANSAEERSAPTAPAGVIAAPVIHVSPTSFHFLVYAFRPTYEPPGQALWITNAGGGTLRWTATDNAGWLTLSSTAGTAPSKVIVRAWRSRLPIGVNGYRPTFLQGTITVSASGASNSPGKVPVSLSISYQR